MDNLLQWFLWFFTYSFIGWIYESILCSITEKKFVNRGFLRGPFCPVYGFGAVICILFLYQRSDNIFVLFFMGMLLTSTLEYITAALLEKLFKSKWWDYSNQRFNIKGRVFLLGAIVFGVFAVLLIKVIHPQIATLTAQIPEFQRYILSVVLLALLAFDLYVTVRHLLQFNRQLMDIQAAFNNFLKQHSRRAGEVKDSILDRFEESEFYNDHIRKLLKLNRIQNTRIIRAFPNLRSLKYHEALQKLKEIIPKEK